MPRLSLPQLVIAGSACAVALFASSVWNTKEYTQWTSEETYKVLTDSPWAKQKSVTVAQSGMDQQRRSGGGGSGRGGGMGGGGIGFPGGGIGFPGGGVGGGGRRNGGGQRQDDGSRGGGGRSSMNVVLRWESALPVQHALLRQGTPQETDQKHYVIAVLGLRLPSRESDRDSNDSDLDRGNDNKDNNDKLRSQLLDAAQLIPNSKVGIAAEDVQFEGRNGSTAIRFLFPKTFPFSAEDKEITFYFESRGMKLEHKFHLADMVYQGKLAL